MKSLLAVFIFLASLSGYAAPLVAHIGVVMDLATSRTASEDTIVSLNTAAKLFKKHNIATIHLDMLDSTAFAVGTRTAMLEMVKRQNDVIIAEISSSKAEVAAVVAEENRKIMITPFATASSITVGRKYVFRPCVTHLAMVKELSKYLFKTMHFTKALTVFDEGQLYSVDLSKHFTETFTGLGGKILGEKTVSDFYLDMNNSDFAANLPKAEFLFLPIYEESAAKVFSKMLTAGHLLTQKFIGADGWGSEGLFESMVFSKKPDFEGYFVTHYNPKNNSAARQEFDAAFKKEIGRKPQTSAAYLTYDSLLMAVEALKKAKNRTQGEIRESMANRIDIQGLTGHIVFSGEQDPVKKPVYINRSIGTHIVETQVLSHD